MRDLEGTNKNHIWKQTILFMKARYIIILISILSPFLTQAQVKPAEEKYRPQIHFSPAQHWMNDPNGMVFYKGIYHFFYQYYPNGTKWGPMHWGHATSKDLIHWKRLPIALYPDKLGYIFSGSVVIDSANTSGLGKKGIAPMVAIFTHHDPEGEKAGRKNYQNQSLAYSIDEGKTWKKYKNNPVLPSPGITDFRDPKVMWYAAGKKWIMTLATKDRITFYSSPNLKNWTRESEFGERVGAHGGVWECPDLLPLTLEGKTTWVLIVNINPGAPNGGSGTQYFTGDFDGKTFTPTDTKTRWADFGTDNYAGVTFSNTGARKVFMGWMNNWIYGDKVPTASWRGAATIPRELSLLKEGKEVFLVSNPVSELNKIAGTAVGFKDIQIKAVRDFSLMPNIAGPFVLKMKGDQLKDFVLSFTSYSSDKLVFGYDQKAKRYYIDRSKAGDTSFDKSFSNIQYAKRVSEAKDLDITIVVDAASIEVFADGGLTNMTAVFFPEKNISRIMLKATNGLQLKEINYTPLKSIW